MALDYFYLKSMRKSHPAWRLMTAENGPLIAAFLDSVFRENNLRSIEEAELVMRLEDYLYYLSDNDVEQEFPRSASEYLDDWSRNDKGWLRKFYPQGKDLPSYDLTPATEKAMQWLDSLSEQKFIGTESRLFAVFDLLRQIVHGVEEDKAERIKELKRQKQELDRQIKAIETGVVTTFNPREIRERFLQFSRIGRELLGDFRMVEHNFRELDRSVREKIAAWSGEKGALLETVFGEHDEITETEQGQSFRAFWDFLMSSGSQDELTTLLDRVFELDELGELKDDIRLKRIHFDWINAGEQTQRMVAKLSHQLRSFLDDRSFYENRRIVKLLDDIDRKSLGIRDDSPRGKDFMRVDETRPSLKLPMERPLYSPPLKIELDSGILSGDGSDIDSSILFNQTFVDKLRLVENIDNALELQDQISLGLLIRKYPLQDGLAELVTYIGLAEKSRFVYTDVENTDHVEWIDSDKIRKAAKIPRIVFQKRNSINE